MLKNYLGLFIIAVNLFNLTDPYFFHKSESCVLWISNTFVCFVAAQVIDAVVGKYGRIDILVNNAAEQHTVETIEDLTPEQLERTFKTNIFSQFFLTRSVQILHAKTGHNL